MSLTLGRRMDDPYVPTDIENLLSLGKVADSVFVQIDSNLADEILVKCNKDNRPVSKTNVQKLAKQIEAGKWVQGAGHIMFNTEGRFIDGQHRLKAISQTGIPLVFCVNFNIPNQAFAVLDTNKKR